MINNKSVVNDKKFRENNFPEVNDLARIKVLFEPDTETCSLPCQRVHVYNIQALAN